LDSNSSQPEQVLSDGETTREQLPKFERGTVTDSEAKTLPSDTGLASPGSITASGIDIEAGGSGRYFLSGPIQLHHEDQTIEGVLGDASRLSFALEADDFGELRIDGLLIVERASGEAVETRLVGFAVKDGESHKIAGLFSISQVGDNSIQRGTFKGTVWLLAGNSAASMELLLAG